MISSVFSFFAAAIGVLVLTPFVRKAALRTRAIDRPGGRRVHARPVPRLGGIGVAVAFYASLGLLFLLDTQVADLFFSSTARVVGLLAGGFLMCLVGALDDLRGVRALHKLGAQVLAAGIAYSAGFRIEAIALPMLPTVELGLLSPIATTLWVIAVINAINLIDGLDGLAAGVTFFACLTNFTMGMLSSDALVMVLSATLGGAVLAFLVFNFNPASIFMGDSGSLFLGYILATSSILGASVKSSTTVAILSPLIALGLPIMDTLVAVIRRVLERRSIFSPDSGHVHHILLRLGLTHRRAVLTLYSMCVFLTAGAVAISVTRNRQNGITLLVISMVAVGVISAVGVLHQALQRGQKQVRGWSKAVNQLRETLPSVLQQLHEANDFEGIGRALAELTNHPPVRQVELLEPQNEALQRLVPTTLPTGAEAGDNLVRVSFPLPPAGRDARLDFYWVNEQPTLSSEADVLLQLVTDACDLALQRCNLASEAAPARPNSEPTRIQSEVLPRDSALTLAAAGRKA